MASFLGERLGCGDGERETPLTRQTATSLCYQRFVRPALRMADLELVECDRVNLLAPNVTHLDRPCD